MVALVWFRRDLRVHDHPALCAALAGHEQVVPVFCLDDRLLHGRHASGARTAFLLESLADLDGQLAARGARLVIRHGPPERELPALAGETGASEVHLSGDPSPYEAIRGRRVRAALERAGVSRARPSWGQRGGRRARDPDRAGPALHGVHPVPPQLARCQAAAGAGRARAARHARTDPARAGAVAGQPGSRAGSGRAWPRAGRAPGWPGWPDSWTARCATTTPDVTRRERMARRGCLPTCGSAACRRARWKTSCPGGAAGMPRVRQHSGASCAGGTSTSTSWCTIRRTRGRSSSPATAARWTGRVTTRDFTAWTEGRTGFPLVDAGMRQLRREGWMHNRVRLLVGSFLTKDLGIDWRRGEDWFMRLLAGRRPGQQQRQLAVDRVGGGGSAARVPAHLQPRAAAGAVRPGRHGTCAGTCPSWPGSRMSTWPSRGGCPGRSRSRQAAGSARTTRGRSWITRRPGRQLLTVTGHAAADRQA